MESEKVRGCKDINFIRLLSRIRDLRLRIQGMHCSTSLNSLCFVHRVRGKELQATRFL